MRLVSVLVSSVLVAACSNDIQVTDGQNTAPTVDITTPEDQQTYLETEVIEFIGVVADGQGLDDVQAVQWTSSIDGELSTIDLARPDTDGISRISGVLSAGNHSITLRATDAEGSVGEDSIQVNVGTAAPEPWAEIVEPINFAEVYPGFVVALLGTVGDDQQDAETLLAEWTVRPNGTTDYEVVVPEHNPDATGLTNGAWTPTEMGNFIIELAVTDDDGLTALAEVFVVVVNPDDLDLDQDGYTPNTGDCNDADYYVNPGVVEVCGNAIDDDCTADATMVPPFDGVDDLARIPGTDTT